MTATSNDPHQQLNYQDILLNSGSFSPINSAVELNTQYKMQNLIVSKDRYNGRRNMFHDRVNSNNLASTQGFFTTA